MRNPSLAKKLEVIDKRVLSLRNQIRSRVDPVEVGRTAAAIYLDGVERLLAYREQLDRAISYEMFSAELSFEENLARGCAILRIFATLNTMFLTQMDCYLMCLGGPNAIAAQQIASWVGEDPARREWLVNVAAMLSRRRRA